MITNRLKLGLLKTLLAGGTALTLLGGASYAHAQALTWTAAGTIDLSDPDIDITIVSGSEATSLVVGTGTFQVVVPNADVFTITSANRSLAETGVTTAVVSDTCVAGVETMTITGGTGGETITVTPGADMCGAGGTSSSSGGSGGSSKKTTPVTPATPATPATPSGSSPGIGAQVSALIAKLKSLVDILESRGVTISTEVKSLLNTLGVPAGGVGAGVFSSDLDVGASGADVSALQNLLIKKGYSIPAGATGFFGGQTRAALVEYQKANGISPAVGFFGPKTRAHVQANP